MSSEADDMVLWPDPRLSQECEEIDDINDDVRKMAEHMLKVMYATDGVGLAGPQVGYMKRMVVIDVDYPNGQENPFVLINPEIKVADGEPRVYEEGCLSFPGITCSGYAPKSLLSFTHITSMVILCAMRQKGDLLAVCLQHEIDHINGVTMPDHLGPGARMETLQEYKEALASGARPGQTDY